MKKLTALILILATLLCILTAPLNSLAGQAVPVNGGTSKGVSFKVTAYSDNAYFVLSSSTGLASVAQHNWLGKYTGDGQEATHGFYRLQYGESGTNISHLGIWVPSATTNYSGSDACEEIVFNLPGKGTYMFYVYPMSTGEAAKYWRMDSINYWIREATWWMSVTSGCDVEIISVQDYHY